MEKRYHPKLACMNIQQRNILFFSISAYFLIIGSIFFQLHDMTWLWHQCASYWHFFIIGLGGAIIANSTGAGGGIVFIPAFSSLGISQSEAVGTSIVIQCVGMTTGAAAWFLSFKKRPQIYQRYETFMKTIITTAGLTSIIGVLLGEYMLRDHIPFSISSTFSTLSICFGSIILAVSLIKVKISSPRIHTSSLDIILCSLIGFFGGLITSIISIGVGEILLMLLFFRYFPIQISIFMAVAISSITVLAAAPYFIWTIQSVAWGVVFFAAPAAMMGGILGQALTEYLGAKRIKIFCALWILFTGFIT